ncbi:uncharacterized protein LOC110600530 [Manihot esculenta]|uniref:uncharacterized protein LOC110600530 n=1 Tax=Manihot esculenta TaxID=3983 RepID=UPI000B5D767E|nr:uncharacterized protein LOC110600530 [Manihot esculenta]
MDDLYTMKGRSRRRTKKMRNLHFYRVELFYSVIDMQFQELNNRFDEVNTNLLLCMIYLDPEYLFSAFDVSKLIELAKFYPYEFLQNFGALVKNVVATKKHIVFPLVYMFVKLSLLLPVAKATFEKMLGYFLYASGDLLFVWNERVLVMEFMDIQVLGFLWNKL